MNNYILVSIIIPVYGVEKWIAQCAKSIFEQDYEHIEYIFVNDATKDKSIEILENVIRNYPNRKNQIKIIHNAQNLGIAKTREVGLNNCNGNYIYQIDSDDWIEPNCISLMVNAVSLNKDIDIVCGNCRDIYHDKKVERRPATLSDNPKEIALKMMERNIIWSIWNRLIKKSLYDNIHIPSINNGDDYIMTIQLMNKAKRCIYIPQITYNYNHLNESSFQNNSKNSINILDRYKAVLFLKKIFKDDIKAINALDIGQLDVIALTLINTTNYKDITTYSIPEKLHKSIYSSKLKFSYRLILYMLKHKLYFNIWLVNNIYAILSRL